MKRKEKSIEKAHLHRWIKMNEEILKMGVVMQIKDLDEPARKEVQPALDAIMNKIKKSNLAKDVKPLVIRAMENTLQERWITRNNNKLGDLNKKGEQKSLIHPSKKSGYATRAEADKRNKQQIGFGSGFLTAGYYDKVSEKEVDEVLEEEVKDLQETTADKQLQQVLDEFLDTFTKETTQIMMDSSKDISSRGEEIKQKVGMKIKELKTLVDNAISSGKEGESTWRKIKDMRNILYNLNVGWYKNFGNTLLQKEIKTWLDSIQQPYWEKFRKEEKKWEQVLNKSPTSVAIDEILDEIEDLVGQVIDVKKSVFNPLLNKAIIETEFVRDYPQYVTEMKEEMKFGNMDQPEAEMKIAKKYRLPILSKLQGRSGGGRWTRMLKVAGAVTSTHTGIESKPRYSKKKKEEDEE